MTFYETMKGYSEENIQTEEVCFDLSCMFVLSCVPSCEKSVPTPELTELLQLLTPAAYTFYTVAESLRPYIWADEDKAEKSFYKDFNLYDEQDLAIELLGSDLTQDGIL